MTDAAGPIPDQQVDMRVNSGPRSGPYAPGATAPSVVPYAPGVTPPPSGPFVRGGASDFASSPAEKNAAAGTIQTYLEPETKKHAGDADEATEAARKGFEGWQTAAALKKVADTWDQQVATLLGRLAGEKDDLRQASGSFASNDIGLGNQFASQSQLSRM
ncbi:MULTISPECIES: hypothetical protein [Streptomyces]|uniref:WXG100 family type VII secretion target n=1 Tax=Streptomyces yangpuensis TaxID=1648182 RepID=A0ABY5PUX7_9ACTN|nr:MULTISPECIES: hypothetical protein [Streptomyces]UUY47563.1 hypothetical protein NRK68_10230 [Streptomyces yangpuensis]